MWDVGPWRQYDVLCTGVISFLREKNHIDIDQNLKSKTLLRTFFLYLHRPTRLLVPYPHSTDCHVISNLKPIYQPQQPRVTENRERKRALSAESPTLL